MSEKIKVAIKVRPLIEREKSEGAQEQWTVAKNSIYLTNSKARDKDCYYFDYVFGQENTNADLFEAITKPIVDASVRGFNGTIFAYGQTSSGKTYTMTGTELDPGIIPRTISYMFQAIHSITSLEGRNFLLRASYMEIYNEKIIDLLEGKEGLKLREADGQVVIAKLKEEVACTAEKILNLMKRGEKIRKTSQTNMNERSSRSHTIFRLIIESGLQEEEENGAVQVSHLNLVDLAGSERVDQSGAVGERLKEGCSINTSLFMLGRVIAQLSEGQEQYVSFRDSKLTRILQSSLGGNAHTAIICTVTPAVVDETISTLGFASRATNIQNKPLKNEVLTDAALLKRYARQIAKLQEELKTKHSSTSNAEIESKLEETRRHNQLLQQRIDLLQEKLIGSTLLHSDTLDKKKALRRRTWGGQTTKPCFSVYLPQTLNPIEEEYESTEQENQKFFTTSDFQSSGFETPLEEFELELIEAERNRFSTESTFSEDSLVTLRKKCRTVSFVDQNVDCQTDTSGSAEGKFPSGSDYIIQFSKCKDEQTTTTEVDCQTDPYDTIEVAVNTTLELTSDDMCSEQCKKWETKAIPNVKDSHQPSTEAAVCVRLSDQFTTETPPKELRERIKYYQKEYDELLEFTTLEKQLICEEQVTCLLQENEQLRRENHEIKRSVSELEAMYLEANRSLSLVKDENKHLKQKLDKEIEQCSELSRRISLLNKTQEKTNGQLKDVLALEKEMKTLKQKLHTLENEKLDFEVIQQLQEEKYNKRITELTKSLEEAWKHSEIINKDETDKSICERCKYLTKELEALEAGPVPKLDGIMPQKHKNELSVQEIHFAKKQDFEYNLLAEKEKALNALHKKLSEAEGKILQLSSTVESRAKCTSFSRESDVALMLLDEQLINKENLTDYTEQSEQTLTLMQEEARKSKNEIIELTETRNRQTACIAALKEKEKCYIASQKELEGKYAELTMILKEKEEIIILLQERLREAENSLEEVRKLTEDYSICVEELKENQETISTLQAQLTNNEIVLTDMKEKLLILTDELNKRGEKIADLEEKLVKAESEIKTIPYIEMLIDKDELSSLRKQLAEKEKLLQESESKCLKLFDNLKEDKGNITLLQRDLIQAESQINEAAKVKQIHEKCEFVIKENQQTVAVLREQLTNNEKSILDVAEKYSEAVDALKESQDSCILLQEKLNIAENELKAFVELKAKHAALIEQFRQKEDIHTSLKEQLTNYQISLSELEQNNVLLTNSLKEKEDALIVLQNKLSKIEHINKQATEIKEMHAMYATAFNEKEESLPSYKQKFADDEVFIAETTEQIFKLSQACIQKEEKIASLEKKLQKAEEKLRSIIVVNCNDIQKKENKMVSSLVAKNDLSQETESNEATLKYASTVGQSSLTEVIQNSLELTLIFKEKEERIAELKQKLQETETLTKDLVAVQEIHSLCAEILKEKEELLALLKHKFIVMETSLEEMTETCSNLRQSLTENEQKTELLQKKLLNFEIELKENNLAYVETSKENRLESAAVEKKLCEGERKELEIMVMGKELSEVLKELDEYSFLHTNLAVDKTVLAEVSQKCFSLTNALKEKEEIIALLQAKLHKSTLEVEEEKKLMKIHSACILRLKEKDELLLCLEEKIVANEIFVAETTQSYSELVKTFEDMEKRITDLEQKLYDEENSQEIKAWSAFVHDQQENDKLILALKENLNENKALLVELTQKYSSLRETLKEKEETITLLQDKLHETRAEVEGKEIHSQCIQKLKEKDALLLYLEEKLAANEISMVETTQSCSKLAEVFRDLEERIYDLEPKLYDVKNKETTKRRSTFMQALEKDKSVLTLQENGVTDETLVVGLTQKSSNFKDILKNKEKIIALLEEKLYISQLKLKKEEEIHLQCIQGLREKDELLSHLQNKVIANEISAAETLENCSKLVAALRGIEESVNSLEQKLYEAENYERQTENRVSMYVDALKEKEEIIALLEEKLLECQSKVDGEEIHSHCIQQLREKDELLLDFERKIITNEISAAETIQNCSKLAAALRAIEEILNALEQKLCEAENCKREVERRLSTYADGLKEKENTVVLLQMKLHDSELEVKEVYSTCMDSIKQKEDSLVILQEKLVAAESAATEMERRCLTLSIAVEEKEKMLALLQEKLHEAEKSEKEIKEMNCVDEVIHENIASKEVFTSDMVKSFSGLVSILKQIEEPLHLLPEKMYEITGDKGTEMHSFLTTLKKAENAIILVQKRMEEIQDIAKTCSGTIVSKEEEQFNISPQEELYEAGNEMGGDTELNELGSPCTPVLKQEVSLVCSQEGLITAEISIEELTKKCSKLTEMLKDKDEALTLLQRKAHGNANMLKKECEKCGEVLKVTPEFITKWQHLTEDHVEAPSEEIVTQDLLKGKLSKAEVELTELKHVAEEHAQCATLLMLKEETAFCLKNELSSNQASMEEKHSFLTNILLNKDSEIEVLKEKCNDMMNKITMLTELKAVHVTCTNILKEKEKLASSLQDKLINSSKYLAKVEEKLVEISREKEESLLNLQEIKNKMENKIIEMERLKEISKLNTEALKQKAKDMLSLEQKPSSNEIFIRELEAANINIVNALNNEEAALSLLELEIHKVKEETTEAAKLKEIHQMYVEVQKESELGVLLLKKEIADSELHIKEIIESQQGKLRAAENETLERKPICTMCSDRKENYFSVKELPVCQEAAEVQKDLNDIKDHHIDNEMLVTNLEQNATPLTNNLRENKSALSVRQEEYVEFENNRSQMIIKVSDASIKGEEIVLQLMDQLLNEKILSAEVEERCSALMNNLEESASAINLLKEKIDNFTKEIENTQLNLVCIECAKIEETDKILNTLKQKITCCEKEISEYKIKLAQLVKYLSCIAKMLNKKESYLKAVEHRLYIAENKLALLNAELSTPLNESGSSLEATPQFHSHVPSENNVIPVPNVSEWDAMVKEREMLQYERNNYQHLYEGERKRLQELSNLYQEELDEIQLSSIASQSSTHNYLEKSAQAQQSFVSDKMLKEIENRKSNNFDSETVSCNQFSKDNTCSKTELETLRNENTILMKTCKELEDTIKECETSLKQLRYENDNLTSELQDKAQEIYSLRKVMMKEISSLNPKLKPVLKEHCLQKLLSTLLSSIIEKQKELHEKMEDHISYLSNKIAEQEKQYVDSDKRKDSWIQQLETEVEQLTKQLDALDSRKAPEKLDSSEIVAKLKEEKQELITKIQYLEQDVKSFQQQISAEAETEELKHKDFISKIDRLESSLLCKDKIIMKLEEEIETKNCKEHQLLVKFENAIKKTNTLECNLKSMEGKLSELEQVKLTLLQELECKCNEEREQKDILISECERNEVLTSQITQLKTNMENTTRKNELLIEQKAKLEQNLEQQEQKNSTLLLKIKAMEQEIDCLKQEALNKDVAFKQKKLALQEEQQKTSLLLMKIEAMEEETGHLQQVAMNKDVTIQQEKLKFEKKIHELEYSAQRCKAETTENVKQMDALIKQLEQEIKIKQCTFENESKKVSELQLNLKVLEEKVNNLDSTNSALSEEVKHKHEMEQKLICKLNTEMQKVQMLANHLAEVTAQKEDIVQRNEELIKRNMKLELQYDLLQKRKMQVQSLLDFIEKEFKTLKEEVSTRKATMVKVYTVAQSCETSQQAHGAQIGLLTCEQQEYILRFQEDIREIKEYLSQTDNYWEELENIRHENSVLYEEHEACKAALEAERSKIAQLGKEMPKECTSSNEETHENEVIQETATRLERTVHQLCKTEKERDHYKKCLKHELEERRVMTHDLQQLKSKLESSRSKNNVLYTHARDLQVRLEELRDRNEHLELENNGAAHRIAQLQEEIKKLREENAATAEKCQCTSLSQEVIQLRNEASEKAAWEQRYKVERRQCQKFERDIKMYKEKVSELKAELHKSHGSQNMCKAKLANVGVQVGVLQKGMNESHDVAREQKELQAKIEKYKELCRYRMQKIRNLEQKVQQLEDSGLRLQGPSDMQSTDKMENKENQAAVAYNRPLIENAVAYSLHSTPQKN